MQCPGSRFLASLYPGRETEASIEGDLAHAILAATLRGEPIPAGATDDMLDGAELFVDAVSTRSDPSLWHVEEHVDISIVNPHCHGTPDFWAWSPNQKILHVADYKFGHVYVDAFENWQMMEYALGIIDTKLPSGGTWSAECSVVLTIVQPRCFVGSSPVRSWVTNFGELRAYLDRIKAAELRAMQPDAPTHSGPECIFCPARHACPTLQKAAHSVMDLTGDNTPFDLTPAAIGGELKLLRDAAAILKARISGLEDEVLARCKQGANIPGWRIEQGMGREKWVSGIDEVIALGTMMGIDISKPGAMTPKQAIKAGLPEELVRSYSATPRGEFKLVVDDLTKPQTVFQGA
jgi:hypothetical protein